MTRADLTYVLTDIAATTGVPIALQDNQLVVDGHPILLPGKLTGEKGELFGIDGLLPTVPRADDRDKLLWHVVAESRSTKVGEADLLKDRDLEKHLVSSLGLGPEASPVAADALMGRFFNDKELKVLLPVHTSLPLNYQHAGRTGRRSRYRMFNGGILPFLLWDSATRTVDGAPLKQLLETVSDRSALTALDRRFLQIALEHAPDPDAKPDADALINRYQSEFEDQMDAAGGAFCQPSFDLFRRDLRTILDTNLPQPDKVEWLTLLLSLHLTVRLYRIAVVKGAELDLAVASSGGIQPPAGVRGCECTRAGDSADCLSRCPLAGMLRFRTGSGRYRPVSARDGCRAAYIEVDQRRLQDMPATLVTATLASRAWEALGGGDAARHRDLTALAAALTADETLRRTHGAACAAIAVLHRDAWRQDHASREELSHAGSTGPNRPGLHALREEVRTMRSRDLRHQGRDIVNQLMLSANLAGPGALIARNGTHGFYEVDEQLLLLLVRLVCQNNQLPYEDFLDGLLSYGLAPQDDAERSAVADALERLGLLARYSDAGEAAFVHYA